MSRSSSSPERAAAVVAVVLVALALAAAGTAANPSVNVTFAATGAIAVTLPNGAPLGTASGTPTVIPAGYYTLQLTGPGGCNELPYFELEGPGENVLDNMEIGEMQASVDVHLLPNSTYTWRDLQFPDVRYTFQTSADVQGSPPPKTTVPKLRGTHATTASRDVVGSDVGVVGSLSVSISKAGKTAVAAHRSLSAGAYRVSVVDRSPAKGLALVGARRRIALSSAHFVGSRTVVVHLTAGTWRVGTAAMVVGS